jgi:non-specific protein-tyrosine kinase
MDVARLVDVARRWLWILVLIPLLAGTTAYLLTKQQTPVYEAKNTILVNQAQPLTGPTYSDVLANQQLTKTYSKLITSKPVLERVAANLGLSYEALSGRISTSAQQDTQLIDISVQHTDPDLAALIANETASTFAEEIRQSYAGRQAEAERGLQDQIISMQIAISERERGLQQLRVPSPGVSETDRLQQLSDAQFQLDSLRRNFTTLQTLLQELRIELGKSMNSVSLANPAVPPQTPIRPHVTFNALLGAALGLLIACGIVALLEYLDDSIRSAGDAERAAGAYLLGSIPSLGRSRWPLSSKDGTGTSATLVIGRNEYRRAEEAFRLVRTNLDYARRGSEGRVVLVTSSSPREGKSTTAANLALLLGQSGRRVVLVDADLRFPFLHRLFRVGQGPGLSTLLSGDTPQLDPAIFCSTVSPNVLLLPSGPLPANPADLLSSQRMVTAIDRLKAAADLVIFDSASILPTADTAALAAHVDGVVLIIDPGRTRAHALSEAAEILRRSGAPLWGLVFNKVRNGPNASRHDDPRLLKVANDKPQHTIKVVGEEVAG